jgi:MYND finger
MADNAVVEEKKTRRIKNADKIPILEYKEIIPTREKFRDRVKIPPILKHFILPAYMRQRKCALIDEDAGNGGMESLIRMLYHKDLNTVMQMPFENAFLLFLPTTIKMSANDPRNLSLPSFVLHPRKIDPLSGQTSEQQTSAQREKEKLIRHAFTNLIERCIFCHYDPREVAAMIVVIYCYYAYHEETLENLRAGVYLANLILMGEGEIPIPAEAMTDEYFALMIAQDCQCWVARRDVFVEMTTGYIKSLVRKCDVCGQLKQKDGRKDLPVMTCTRCNHGYYCSRECQVTAYEVHKPFCFENRSAIQGQKSRARPPPLPSHLPAAPVDAPVATDVPMSEI